MRHEAALLFGCTAIISILACALPDWTETKDEWWIFKDKANIGLWEACGEGTISLQGLKDINERHCMSLSDNNERYSNNSSGDLVACQIFSIVAILTFTAASVLCIMKLKGVRICGAVGLVAALITLIVYAASRQQNLQGSVSTCFYLEISAMIIGIWAMFVPPTT